MRGNGVQGRAGGGLELANTNMPFTNISYKPTQARITRGHAVSSNGMVTPGSAMGSAPAPPGIVSNILAAAWGGGNDNKLEFDYLTNWHNIHGRHDGITLVAKSQRLAEEIVNARGALFLALVAPPLITNELYVTIANSEPYITPMDNMAMQGTPYESTRFATQETYGLASYKAMESITSEYLRDFYFGKEALAELSYVLGRRLLVTLVDNAASAIVDIPWKAALKKFMYNNSGSFVGYYVALEGIMFAGVNKNPKRALMKILETRTMPRPIDRIGVAENKGAIFKDALELPKNLAYYLLAYDNPTGQVISAMFDNGPLGVGSVGIGQGEGISVIQVPTMVSSSMDNEEDGVQRLRTFPVLGELIQERLDVTVQEATGSVNDNDVCTWSESMTEIVHPWLRHHHGLKYGGLFNTFEVDERGTPGPVQKQNKMGASDASDFGEEYKKLVVTYANNRAAVTYLMHPNPSDNNTPPHGSANARSLSEMKEWREYYPIVGVYQDLANAFGGSYYLAYPARVGDVSLRGIHPGTLRDATLKIDKDLRKLGNNVSANAKLAQVWSPVPTQQSVSFASTALDAMDVSEPLHQAAFDQDRAALAQVTSARDLSVSVIGQLAHGTDSFVEHARHVPDSHLDQFITVYKACLDQLKNLSGSDALPLATDNFKNRLLEFQSLRGQASLLTAITRASDRVTGNVPLAEWTQRLLKNAERNDRSGFQNPTFVLEGLLKQTPVVSAGPSLGASVTNTLLGVGTPDTYLDSINNMNVGAFQLHRNRIADHGLDLHQTQIYNWLLTMPFNYWTLTRLYQTFGVTLVAINRYRNRQYYQMSAITGFCADRSYITMFTHPQARSGVAPVQGMVYETIEVRTSVIPLDPLSTMIFPYAFCDRLINEINCRPARTLDEATSVEPDAPSLWCTIVPKDESAYDFPFSLTGADIHANKPRAKHSDTDLLNALFKKSYLMQQGTRGKSPVVYQRNGVFADIIHRSWKRYFDERTRMWQNVNGTGPREESFVNACESHHIWAGAEPAFPVKADVLTYSPAIEIVA